MKKVVIVFIVWYVPATVLRVLNSSSYITLPTTISDISLNYKLGNGGSERVRILLQIVSRLKRLVIISGLCDSRIHSLNISSNRWFWLSRSLQLSYIELNLRKTCMHWDNFHIFFFTLHWGHWKLLQILQAGMELSRDSRWSEHELISKDSEASKCRADLRAYSPP